MAIKAYVDTCIVSRFADGKAKAADLAALADLRQAEKAGTVELYISAIVTREISDVPQQYRAP